MNNRTKLCEVCKQEFDVMFRIQYKNPKKWIFSCEKCLLEVKKNNPLYKYGGTWKR